MEKLHRTDSEFRKHLIPLRDSAQKLNPKILYAGALKKSKNWQEEPHSHPFCEILYISEGEGTVETENGSFSVSTGDVVLYNAGATHCERSEDGVAFLFFAVTNLKFSLAPQDMPLDARRSPVLRFDAYAQDFAYLFKALVREANEKRKYGDEACRGIANTILCLLLRLLSDGEEKYLSPNETYLRLRGYIDEHYLKIRKIDELCEAMFVSRYYLTHLFKEYAGVSPLRYLLEKRIDYAKQRLVNSDDPIDRIAEETGYSDPNSFVKMFRKSEKMSPAAYRKIHGCNHPSADKTRQS